MPSYTMNVNDVRFCNCAGCGQTLLGEKTCARLDALQPSYWPKVARETKRVAGRVDERPYCADCLAPRRLA